MIDAVEIYGLEALDDPFRPEFERARACSMDRNGNRASISWRRWLTPVRCSVRFAWRAACWRAGTTTKTFPVPKLGTELPQKLGTPPHSSVWELHIIAWAASRTRRLRTRRQRQKTIRQPTTGSRCFTGMERVFRQIGKKRWTYGGRALHKATSKQDTRWPGCSFMAPEGFGVGSRDCGMRSKMSRRFCGERPEIAPEQANETASYCSLSVRFRRRRNFRFPPSRTFRESAFLRGIADQQ